MRRFFASIRVRLILLVLIAVVPALGLTLYTGLEQRRIAAAQVQMETLRLTRLAANDQAQLLAGARQLLLTLAQLPEMRNSDSTVCAAFLAALRSQFPRYANLGVAVPNGDLRCSAVPSSTPVNYADRDWLARALRTRDFVVGSYTMGRITRAPLLSFAYPLLNEHGQIEAVLFGGLDLAWLNQLIAEADLPPGATFTVIDRNGVILARDPDPASWVGQAMPEAPIVKAILDHRAEGTTEAFGVDGIRRLYAFAPLIGAAADPDAYVTIGFLPANVFAEPNRLLAQNLGGLAIVTALALAAAWLGGDLFLLRRVRTLLHATEQLAAGNLGARSGLLYGAGELNQLARSFDRMAESLQQRTAERQQAEAALADERNVLHTLIDNLPDNVFIKDTESRIIVDNVAHRRLLGASTAEQAVGKTDFDFFAQELAAAYYADEQNILRSGEPLINREEPTVDRDGNQKWLLTTKVPLRDHHGQIIGIVGVNHDITERVRKEEQIRQDAARDRALAAISQVLAETSLDYQALLDTIAGRMVELIGDACIVTLVSDDGQSLRLAAAHHADASVVGFLRARFGGAPQRVGEGAIGRVALTGQPTLIPIISQDELRSAIKPEYRPYPERFGMYSLLIVPLRAQGRVIGTLGLVRDHPGQPYTADDQVFLQDLADRAALAIANARLFQEVQAELARRRQAEEALRTINAELESRVAERTAELHQTNEALREKTEELDRFFSLALDLLCIADTAGYFRRLNPAWETTLGYSLADLEGQRFLDLVHPEDIEPTLAAVAELSAEQTIPTFVNRYRCKDGTYRWIEWRSVPYQGRLIYAAARDITERKRAEEELRRFNEELERRVAERTAQLERSNRDLQDFAYVASHDLQEPLRKVQAFGDRLQARYSATLGEDGRDYLGRMQNAAARMSTMITDLLAYSRVTTRGQPFAPVDLGQVAREVVSDLETRIEETGGRVEVGDLPTVTADPTQMRQLLQNLIGNALKFHRESVPPLVKITAQLSTAGAPAQTPQQVGASGMPNLFGGVSGQPAEVCIAVTDNGIGFDEKYLDRIFTPFQRLHGRGEYEGSGIGLAICRKIVERHGGTITARSAPGQGATFIVSLRIADS
jgi:PAS domain S-box-containing protein